MAAQDFILPVYGNVTSRELLEAAIRAVVDALYDEIGAIATSLRPVGEWEPSSGAFPSGSEVGTYYIASDAGTVDTETFAPGDWLVPLVDNASTSTASGNWMVGRYSKVADGIDGRTFNTTSALAAASGLRIGQRVFVKGSGWYEVVEAGTATANGNTVIDGLGVQAVLAWDTPLADYAAFVTDTRAAPAIGTTVRVSEDNLSFVYWGDTADVVDGKPGWHPVGPLRFAHFGAVGDNSTDDTLAVKRAVAFADDVTVEGDDRTYVLTDTVDISNTLKLRHARFRWAGAAEATVFTLNAQRVKFLRCRIDGDNIAATGISDIAGRNVITRSEITGIYSSTGSARGIEGLSAVGSQYYRNEITEIHSVGDATLGNANGSARAIMVETDVPLTRPYRIENNDISGVSGEEGDAIQILCHNGTDFLSALDTIIRNNVIEASTKRGVKIQANQVLFVDNRLTLLDGSVNLFAIVDVLNSSHVTIGRNILFTDQAGTRGVNVTYSTGVATTSVIVIGNEIILPFVDGDIGRSMVINGADECVVSDNIISYGAMVFLESRYPTIERNIILRIAATGTEAAIRLQSTVYRGTVNYNKMKGGAAYSLLRIESANTVARGNENHSSTSNGAVAVVASAGNILALNISELASPGPIEYTNGQSAGTQKIVSSNAALQA